MDYPNHLVNFDMPTVIIAGTENEVKECYEVCRQLCPTLTRKSFTEQVLRQMKDDNYKIACVKKDSKVVACAGFRILETLSWGKALYIDPSGILLIPTSITTTSFFTISAVINPGFPAATMRISASLV